MTAYIITPEQHAQIVDALTQWTTPNWAGSGVDQCNAALAMLKSMKPVEPAHWTFTGSSRLTDKAHAMAETKHCGGTTKAMALYAKEQQ